MTDDQKAAAVERVIWHLYLRERVRIWWSYALTLACIVVGLVTVLFYE